MKTRELNILARPLSLNQTFAEADKCIAMAPEGPLCYYILGYIGQSAPIFINRFTSLTEAQKAMSLLANRTDLKFTDYRIKEIY